MLKSAISYQTLAEDPLEKPPCKRASDNWIAPRLSQADVRSRRNIITPYKETELHGPNFTQPPPDLIDGEPEYEVEKILDKKQKGKGRETYYLIKWKGYPASDNSWEPASEVHAPKLITEWEKKTNKNKGRKL